MRRIAIADIHGCSQTYIRLLNRIRLTRHDTLYILGDFINKGPDSKGVLDHTLRLISEGYKIHCLKGNHDQMLIEPGSYRERWEEDADLLITLESFGVSDPSGIPSVYSQFLNSLPYYIILGDFILVHAGINFSVDDPMEDHEAMLTTRFTPYDAEKAGGRAVLHGHTPLPLDDIRQLVDHRMKVINIDAGCSKMAEGYKHLVALDLDTMEVHAEPNADS